MPRKPRSLGNLGVYHVILRGVNRQRIFEWDEDYQAFIRIIDRAMHQDNLGRPTDPNYDLYAYCLMDNHVHLLLREQGQKMSVVVKRIATAYARYFNGRYKRVGHLFQDRYRSEPCDTAEYLLTLLDYIHNNPVKAGVTASPGTHKYSSYNELKGCEVELPLCTIPEDYPGLRAEDIKRWVKEMPVADEVDERKTTQRGLSPMCSFGEERSCALLCNLGENSDEVDQMIVNELLRLGGCETISEFQQLEKKPMRSALAQVRDAGVSIRRLSRLSGISEGVIRYSKNPNNLPSQPK